MVRRKQHTEPAFNRGTLLNMTSIFGGLLLSGAIYVTGNYFLYGNELQRHDIILTKLGDTVVALDKTVAVLAEQEKQIAETIKHFNDKK